MKETEGLYRSFRLLIQLVVGAGILFVVLGVIGYLFFMRTADVPQARKIAERELMTGTLRFGERVQKAAHAYIRRPSDSFRGANGVLAATNERLIFIGVAPEENLETGDAPVVIVQQEFPNDTLLEVDVTRVFFGTARGVIVRRAGHEARYGATGRHWHELEDLAAYVTRLHSAQRLAATREQSVREAARRVMTAPLYYTVKRGDAISTLATTFGTTVENLQQWNSLDGPRIKIGQRLVVKKAGSR